jgi:hypothetical protein
MRILLRKPAWCLLSPCSRSWFFPSTASIPLSSRARPYVITLEIDWMGEGLLNVAHLVDVPIDGDDRNPEPIRVHPAQLRDIACNFALGDPCAILVQGFKVIQKTDQWS